MPRLTHPACHLLYSPLSGAIISVCSLALPQLPGRVPTALPDYSPLAAPTTVVTQLRNRQRPRLRAVLFVIRSYLSVINCLDWAAPPHQRPTLLTLTGCMGCLSPSLHFLITIPARLRLQWAPARDAVLAVFPRLLRCILVRHYRPSDQHANRWAVLLPRTSYLGYPVLPQSRRFASITLVLRSLLFAADESKTAFAGRVIPPIVS